MRLVPIAQVVIRFRRLLYSTDCRSKCIERMDKATGNQRSVLRERLEGLMEIRAAAKDKQTAILARKLTVDAVIGVCSAPFRTFAPVLISPTTSLARPVSGFTQF